MRTVLIVVLLLVCGVVGVAFYRHWVEVQTTSTEKPDGTQHTGVKVTVNKEQAKEDLDKVGKEAKELAKKTEEKVQEGVKALRGRHTMDGIVTAWDESHQKLTLKTSGGGEEVFQVDPKCKVQSGKEQVSLQELKVDDRVAVKYEERGGSKVAEAIQVQAVPVSPPETR